MGGCCCTGKLAADCAGVYALAIDVGLSGCWYDCGGFFDKYDIPDVGAAEPLGGGPSGGVDFGSGPNEEPMFSCCSGWYIEGGLVPTPGVPRLEVGDLKKSSGVSFQVLIFVDFEGGGMEGEALMVLGGGASG